MQLNRFSSADVGLARRVEAAEAANAFELIQGALELDPQCGWRAEEICGGCAMYGGLDSPMTHLLGGGMGGPYSSDDFDRLEEFYRSKGSPCLIDLCPLADLSFIDQVFRRGYRVIELNNLMVRRVEDEPLRPPAASAAEIGVAGHGDARAWSELVSRGFSPDDTADPVVVQALESMPRLGVPFWAKVEGQPAAGGALGLQSGTALFYGDATRSAWRGRGLQTALIEARLRHAREAGADLAMVTVVPGTSSHRNYERAGFQLVYMRVNLMRELK